MPTIEIFLLSVFRFIVSIFDLWLVWVENIFNKQTDILKMKIKSK